MTNMNLFKTCPDKIPAGNYIFGDYSFQYFSAPGKLKIPTDNESLLYPVYLFSL
jgi:hypothetical protein